jgi:hypothetical protein
MRNAMVKKATVGILAMALLILLMAASVVGCDEPKTTVESKKESNWIKKSGFTMIYSLGGLEGFRSKDGQLLFVTNNGEVLINGESFITKMHGNIGMQTSDKERLEQLLERCPGDIEEILFESIEELSASMKIDGEKSEKPRKKTAKKTAERGILKKLALNSKPEVDSTYIKFDDESPVNWGYKSRINIKDYINDGDFIDDIEMQRIAMGEPAEFYLLENPQEFISKLKTAKKLTIGDVKFGNVEGLESPQTNDPNILACRKKDFEELRETAEKFAKANIFRDFEKMKSVSTKKGKGCLVKEEKEYKEEYSPKEREVIKELAFKVNRDMSTKCESVLINENGNLAHIEFSFIAPSLSYLNVDSKQTVSLIKEKSTWKVYSW